VAKPFDMSAQRLPAYRAQGLVVAPAYLTQHRLAPRPAQQKMLPITN